MCSGPLPGFFFVPCFGRTYSNLLMAQALKHRNKIRENIAIGNPAHLHDTERIERAAALGGCSEIIDRLSDKFDTFLSFPIQNMFSHIPAGTLSLFGADGVNDHSQGIGRQFRKDVDLSGGEKQRLAL